MPSPHDPDQQAQLASNDMELTDAEKGALTPDAAAGAAAAGEGAAAAATAAPAGAEGAAPAAGSAEGAAEGAAAPAPDGAAAPDPAPAAAAGGAQAPPAPPAPFVATFVSPARDFERELADVAAARRALKEQHAAGSIEDDEYDRRFDELQDQKTSIMIAQNDVATRAELSRQNADQSWAYLQNQFFASADNAPIRANPIVFSAWESAMQVVVDEAHAAGRTLTDWDVMHQARAKLVESGLTIGTAAAAPAPTGAAPATPQPKPDRTPPMGNVPQTLAFAPSAAAPGTPSTTDQFADMDDIEALEEAMAKRSEAERDAVLRGTPGAFLGN